MQRNIERDILALLDGVSEYCSGTSIVARIAEITEDGVVYVSIDRGPAVQAKILAGLNPADVRDAFAGRRDVLIVAGDSGEITPIVVGVILDRLPQVADAHDAIRVAAEKELVLECGESSISLRRDGKISIKGRSILSRSKGVHKIQGGSVRIN